MTKPARKEPVRADLGTKERHAKGDVRTNNAAAKSERRAQATTSVERIAAQKDADGEPKLSARQVAAAKQYYVCAAAFGVFGRYASMDLAKEVFGVGPDDGAELLEDKKREYIAAADCISPRYKQAMHAIILYDATLTQAGNLMGRSGPNAGATAFPMLQDTLDRLANFFNITVVGDERDYKKQDNNQAAWVVSQFENERD